MAASFTPAANLAPPGRRQAAGAVRASLAPLLPKVRMSHALPSRALAAAALALLAGLSLPAGAQVHKCTQADGSVTFQSGPCISDSPREDRVSAAQLNAAQRARERARARAAAASQAASTPPRHRQAGPKQPK